MGEMTARDLLALMVEEFGFTETLATFGWVFACMVKGVPPDPVALRREGVGVRMTRWKHLARLQRVADLAREDRGAVLRALYRGAGTAP